MVRFDSIKHTTPFGGLVVFRPKVYADERGSVFESYTEHYNLGNFVHELITCSKKNVIRGLHFQSGYAAQGKLCQVIYGRILDVSVDIRFNSPTFGEHFCIELNNDNKTQVWIPPGFAHGFSVLSDEAYLHYKCTYTRDVVRERVIRYDDECLNIDWLIEKPIVAEKDKNGISFDEYWEGE